MLDIRTQNEFGVWGLPGRRPVVVYGMALLGRLATEVTESSPGPDGGVLFGTADGQEIRILAARSVECARDAESGSAFTEAGEDQLARWAASSGDGGGDPELAGLEPVGWYRSRWESPIQLNPDDLRIWNEYFASPSQVSLVLRVQDRSPVRAGFFFRPPNGGPVRIDSGYQTFEIGPTVVASAPAEEAPPVLAAPPPDLFTPPVRPAKRGTLILAAAGMAAIVLAGLAAAIWRPAAARAAPPVREAGLRFIGAPDRLRLVWRAGSPLIGKAASAELRIIDAESDTVELISASQLQSGERAVSNRGGQVEAQLRVQPSDPSLPSVTVVAQYIGAAAGDARMSEAELAPLRAELEKLQASVTARQKANTTIADRIKKIRDLMLRRGLAKALTAIPAAAAIEAPGLAEPPPPILQSPVGGLPPTPLSQTPVFGTDRAPSRAASAPVNLPEPVAASYTGPASGKFIWTGYLAAGATVTIDGRRASAGSVNGSLPGVPVRVAVYPGEFSTTGLSVFSALPRHQAGSVTETRSAQNGWLNTRYVYDPGRARDAQISAAPSEAGGFKQLQIRGGDRAVSVVVVEWSVAR